MSTLAVSLVIPAFNEASRLPGTLAVVETFLETEGLADTWEVIVVDDGSTDGTSAAIASFLDRIRLIRIAPNRGKGYAVRQGVMAATGELIMLSDADLSAPIGEWKRLRDRFPVGGIAIGSRGLTEDLIGDAQPAHRRFLGKVFNLTVRSLAGVDLKDTQCGFKLFDGAVARRLFSISSIDGFAFDVEILFLALRQRIPVVEIPVVWNHVPASRVRIVRDSAAMLFDLLRMRWRHRQSVDSEKGTPEA